MKKLLYTLIFFVCILASCFVTNSVFADTEIPVTIKGTTENITIPDCTITQKYNYFLCISVSDNSNGTISVNFDFCVSTSDLVYIDVDTSDNVVFRCPDGVVYGASFRSAEGSVSKVFNRIQSKVNDFFNSFTEDDLLNSSSNFSTIGKNFINTSVANITNTTIKDEDGNLVFQGAPRPVEQVTIPEITQVAEIPQVITQVMKIMIPIGLIIFGIGLVIYLIRLVTSRVT